jgi:class 3 adenylate cyclase/alpha-beta hydrolase superfamily lysophospholipase
VHACVTGAPDVHYARNGTVALAYQVFGRGPLEVVFAPQWINNLDVAWQNPVFARFLNRLGSFAQVLFFDRRGMGLSDRLSAEDAPPLETLVEDLRVVMDAAGFTRPVLFGGSDAGCICALFAATHPDRASALIVYGPEARGTATRDYPWAWTSEDWQAYLAEMETGWGREDYGTRWFRRLMPSAKDDAEQEQWWLTMHRGSASPSSIVAIERIWAELDIRPVLPTIQTPTLVLHRRDDPIEDVGAGRDFARRIPGGQFVELTGGDWPVWAGDQEELFDAIETFLHGITEEEAELDRVLATVLFTDMVGSTEKATILGDRAWRELAERHNTAVRAMLGRYRGVEQDVAGDGFFATFDGPARGVKCAQAIVDAVRGLEIEVRAGVHTGEVGTAGGKAAGIAVNVAARIVALAEPSQVLVSQTVKDLVAGSGLRFDDRGSHDLKGVEGEWHLYAASKSGPKCVEAY